jgi:hypothetical protein
MISDTSPEAEAVQIEIFRRMTGEERLLTAMRLSDELRDIALAGLKNRHPDMSEGDLENLFYREIHRFEIKGE